MQSGKIQTNTRRANSTIGVIDIQGEVTGFAENILMESYLKLINDGIVDVILNFKDMEYMNSSGIGLLVTLFIRASRNGHRLGAVELKSHFRRVFGLTRLQDVVPVFDTEDEAVIYFSDPGNQTNGSTIDSSEAAH
jgi:anti-sigma B factor antagonist